jgi:hypothetical protein
MIALLNAGTSFKKNTSLTQIMSSLNKSAVSYCFGKSLDVTDAVGHELSIWKLTMKTTCRLDILTVFLPSRTDVGTTLYMTCIIDVSIICITDIKINYGHHRFCGYTGHYGMRGKIFGSIDIILEYVDDDIPTLLENKYFSGICFTIHSNQ